MDYCNRYNLNHITYDIVPYDEMAENIVRDKLCNANYIIGGAAYVGRAQPLFTRFADSLRKDVIILESPARIASPESICKLTNTCASITHKISLERATAISELLAAKTEEITSIITNIAKTVSLTAETVSKINQEFKVQVNDLHARNEKTQILYAVALTIGGVTDTTRSIASQTNLLALNAAIEAARAGDSGRGFAVVAQEVRNLAELSNKSINSIKSSVDDVQKTAKDITPIIERLASKATEIQNKLENILNNIEHESASIQEIVAEMSEIALISEQLVSSVQKSVATEYLVDCRSVCFIVYGSGISAALPFSPVNSICGVDF